MTKGVSKFWRIATILLLVIVVIQIFTSGEGDPIASEYVAVYSMTGPIFTQGTGDLFQSSAEITSRSAIDQLQSFEDNDNVKAVIIRLNSPGGSPVPSHKIAEQIRSMEKPVVTVVEDVAASGGYFIASATDYIVADEFSFTGSIGVIGSYLNFGKFIEDYNITYERLVSGPYKDLGVPFKELNEDERGVLQQKIDTLHDLFVSKVAEYRELTPNYVQTLATGDIYLTQEAIDLGLVDAKGGMTEAEDYIKAQLNNTDIEFREIFQEPSLFDALFTVNVQHNLPSVVSQPLVRT